MNSFFDGSDFFFNFYDSSLRGLSCLFNYGNHSRSIFCCCSICYFFSGCGNLFLRWSLNRLGPLNCCRINIYRSSLRRSWFRRISCCCDNRLRFWSWCFRLTFYLFCLRCGSFRSLLFFALLRLSCCSWWSFNNRSWIFDYWLSYNWWLNNRHMCDSLSLLYNCIFALNSCSCCLDSRFSSLYCDL